MNVIKTVTNGMDKKINIITYSCKVVVVNEFFNTRIASESFIPESRSTTMRNKILEHAITKKRTITFMSCPSPSLATDRY
jgi:hypothetical protein